MLVTHKIAWDQCLSNQIWPAIEKGWKDEDKPIHFFWGLAGQNRKHIIECNEKNEEWWYIDVGYITEQITRYPVPKINDYDLLLNDTTETSRRKTCRFDQRWRQNNSCIYLL